MTMINEGMTIDQIVDYSLECLRFLRDNDNKFKEGELHRYHHFNIKETLTKTIKLVNEPIFERYHSNTHVFTKTIPVEA